MVMDDPLRSLRDVWPHMVMHALYLNYVFFVICGQYRRALGPGIHDAVPSLVTFFGRLALTPVNVVGKHE